MDHKIPTYKPIGKIAGAAIVIAPLVKINTSYVKISCPSIKKKSKPHLLILSFTTHFSPLPLPLISLSLMLNPPLGCSGGDFDEEEQRRL